MKSVRELEAWSTPGQILSNDYGKELQQEVWNAGIPRDVFLGLSAIPDETDSENLRLAMEAGELTARDFLAFCSAHGVAPDPAIPQSAAKFLEYSLGRRLAWIHLPENGDPALLGRLDMLLKSKGHVIVDPDTMSPLM